TLGSAPTLTGWSFLGWYNNSSLTTKIGNAGQTLTKPNLAGSGTVTLYAYWQANTYTVKYEANKPSNATSSVSTLPNDSTWTYDANCTLPSQTPTLEGWTFGGWYKEASCTNKLGNAGESLSKPNLRETAGTAKVYAKWIPNTYTVKYNANKPERAPAEYEVTGLPGNVTWTYDSETPVTFGSAPELDGYRFDGWFNDATCQNKVAEAEESSVKPNLTSENGADANLYAKWVFNDAVQAVVDEINATKTVGYDGLTDQIEIAESAYAGLYDINKTVVDSEGYRHILDNANAAEEVGQMIEDLGVALDTDEWREEVGEVREAYMALEDKTYIPNETILSILEDDEAAIIVMDAINEIGATRYNETSKGKIDAAQDAYDAYIDAAHPHEQIANYGKLTAAHTDYDNVQTFVDKVNDITSNPFEYTEGCLALIEEARDYFETTLSDYQKNLATTDAGSYYDLLVNYERAYNAMHLIDEINDMVDEPSCGEKIDSARSAVSSLDAETELTLMREDLLKELDDKETAWGVMNLINDIYPMSYGMNCLRDIEEARSAYDALNDERKELVANYAELTKAEEDYSSVEAVVGEVNSLCAIRHDEESLAKIVSARNHYEALTTDQKGFFPNYSLQEIVDYETVYEALDQIYEIGVVEYDSEPEGRINKARSFYDSLTSEQKMLIDPEDLMVLKTAEKRYAELTKNARVLVIFLLIFVCLLILGAAYVLYILLFRNKDDRDEEENTKEVQKAASFGGLTIGLILTSHYLDAPYIALYVLSGIAIIAWTACLVIYLKKRYDKWAAENKEEGESRGHRFIRLLLAIKEW
ncbi:MAG: InlB B-repeat-containing protein, partial [Bacilli bacterium]|nr:InlB B-repeat-containing protein [Bacilli bacterium]